MALAAVSRQPLSSGGLFVSTPKDPTVQCFVLLIYFNTYLVRFYGAERVRADIPTVRDPHLSRVICSFCPFSPSRTTGCCGRAETSHRHSLLGETQTEFRTSGRYFEDMFFTDRAIPYHPKPINDAKGPPPFRQAPGVPGRSYLMQLRRCNQTRYLPQIFLSHSDIMNYKLRKIEMPEQLSVNLF